MTRQSLEQDLRELFTEDAARFDTTPALARLRGPATPRRRPFRPRDPSRSVLHTQRARLIIGACVVTAVAFFIANALPAGTTGGVALAQAKAAITAGEARLAASSQPVLYTREVTSTTQPGKPTTHLVQQTWQTPGGTDYRSESPSGQYTATDIAALGGVTAYYVPAARTIYINRPQHPSLSGFLTSRYQAGIDGLDDPNSGPLAAEFNVASGGTSSIRGAISTLESLPGSRVSNRAGLITVSARNGSHESTIVVHAGTYRPVLIRWSYPDPENPRGEVENTTRYSAYDERLPAAQAARSFDLLLVYPNATVKTTHEALVRLKTRQPLWTDA